jgi:tRNA pseudouridine13 synthase
MLDKVDSFARVYPSLHLSAKLKQQADDFIVEEHVAVELSGEGEHCWLYLQKSGCNTDWVAQRLARYCNMKKSAVSYAGLKDRHAVTSQWFSVHLPGKPTPDWNAFEAEFNASGQPDSELRETVKILQSSRHHRKLQRGALNSNTFKITLRQLSNTSDESFRQLKQRCEEIAVSGVPNYFGSQRFGRNQNNLLQAEKFFLKPVRRLAKHKRSLYLSAARSWLFNCILSERVKNNLWNRRLPGDVFMLAGKTACFCDEADSSAAGISDLIHRLERNEIHPTAVLWGEGDTMVTSAALELESEIISRYPVFRDGLIAARLKAQRRACRVVPEVMKSYRQGDDFVVSFRLPAGSYATMVLAEIFTELH